VSARIKAVRSKLKIGARYRFTYHGTETLKTGQTVKKIRVERILDEAPDVREAELLREPGDEADPVPF
jgi:hypothetical protein